MADSKLEEVIDLLAEYGGFNREYLRDKLLTFANDRCSEIKNKPEDKNKMEQVASMFNKELDEEFKVKYGDGLVYEVAAKFTEKKFRVKYCEVDYWHWDNNLLADLITGRAVIIDE